MKLKNLQPTLLYPARISFKYEGEIKSFTDKQKAERIQHHQTSSSTNAKRSSLDRKNKKNYYLKPLMEIFSEEKISTGSVKYNLYQKNILESYDYIADGHIDVFCSSVGDIGINSNIF